MRCDSLVFDAISAAVNVVIHGGLKLGKMIVLQMFVLLVVLLHLLWDVIFYCLDYGGG